MEIEYFNSLLTDYAMPGIFGGFIIGFSVYFLSLGISFAYKMISSVTN